MSLPWLFTYFLMSSRHLRCKPDLLTFSLVSNLYLVTWSSRGFLLSLGLYVCLFVGPFVCLSVCPFVRLSVCLFVHLSSTELDLRFFFLWSYIELFLSIFRKVKVRAQQPEPQNRFIIVKAAGWSFGRQTEGSRPASGFNWKTIRSSNRGQSGQGLRGVFDRKMGRSKNYLTLPGGLRGLPEVFCLRLWGWVLSIKMNQTQSDHVIWIYSLHA